METSAEAGSSKRRHIVETAYALFKQAGFHATGIDRIIAEADVAKMTMYRNFPSKDGLIVEVLNHRARRFDRQLDRLTQGIATPERKIRAIFDWYGRWFQRPDFHGCLFAHALAEFGDPAHPVFAAVTAQKKGLQRRFEDILAAIMPKQRAESSAAALLMLIEGATLVAQMGQGDRAIRQAWAAAQQILESASRTR